MTDEQVSVHFNLDTSTFSIARRTRAGV